MRKAVEKCITEGEITGEDFNSMGDFEEIKESFDTNKKDSKTIFSALAKVRMNTVDGNVPKKQTQRQSSARQMGNNSGVIGHVLSIQSFVPVLREWLERIAL